ncbi:6-hydroxy-D-nicotine oxidase [Fusarium subglutinans]|uniref:6-hydroxy-D-nicotine oxidase n=1 Tax=Gibberella subglutinans TaxID=42677 RepID=A0A8H5NZT4_GIBSU|nr:6-hydroxy-D-nicotine oxidase [Fusarium subglutinans]KAF5585561.1 6-hydroxy-D-nicotine oxidase [Fusarium subglutinans]
MSAQIKGVGSFQCEYVVPDHDTPQLPRWSDTHIERPALIVTPKTEQDVKDAIRVAKESKLTIVAAGGGHGTFVSVDSASLYLDMKLFKKIELNKHEGTVKFGGGVLVGEVLKTLAKEGYYTPIPNSDAVGFVGSMLGGGNSAQIGRHGWMVDNVVSFRLVTASGDIAEVDSSSRGKGQVLFNVLSGAGHGLALDVAIKAFLDLSHPPAEGYMSLAFARSPPGTPAAGSPIIILAYQYFGPAEQAENATALLFHDDVVSKTVVANTELLPFENVNAKMNIYNSHHSHKTIASCRLHKTTAEAIKAGFEKWRIATEEYPDAQQSSLIISAYNIDRTSAIKNEKFVEGRDRNINAFMVMVAKEDKTREAFGPVLDDVVAGFRKSDEGMVPRSFPNNLRPGKDLSDMYDRERLEVLRDVKKTWDAEGVFWSPYSKTV